jgi:hypothetical protein
MKKRDCRQNRHLADVALESPSTVSWADAAHLIIRFRDSADKKYRGE